MTTRSSYELSNLGLGASALDDPLSYPGVPATTSGLLVDGHLFPIGAEPGRRLEQQRVSIDHEVPGLDHPAGADLDLGDALIRLGVAGLGERESVLAYGSNASPGQMRAKLVRTRVSTVLPMMRASVDGWRLTVAAHVSRPGYVPLTVVPDDEARDVEAVVLLCDQDQLVAIDHTEATYRRVPGGAAVRIDGDHSRRREVLRSALYIASHGALCDDRVLPRCWRGEADAIGAVMALLPALGHRGIRTPEDFVVRCRADEPLRAWVRNRLHVGGHAQAPLVEH